MLTLRSSHAGAGSLLRDAVTQARAAGMAEGGKGVVLVHARRAPSSIAGGVSDGVLLTIRACQGAGVRADDVAALLVQSKKGNDLLRPASGGEGDDGTKAWSSDAIDALLLRDEKLASVGVVLTARQEMTIAHAPTKPTPPPRRRDAAEDDEEEEGEGDDEGDEEEDEDEDSSAERAAAGGAARRVPTGSSRVDDALKKSEQRRAARERDVKATANPTPTPAPETAEERFAREQRRRQQMQEEELGSAHVAHAAVDELEGGAAAPGGAHEEEEAVVDLDETEGGADEM